MVHVSGELPVSIFRVQLSLTFNIEAIGHSDVYVFIFIQNYKASNALLTAVHVAPAV
jgi:hypothetical protein